MRVDMTVCFIVFLEADEQSDVICPFCYIGIKQLFSGMFSFYPSLITPYSFFIHSRSQDIDKEE